MRNSTSFGNDKTIEQKFKLPVIDVYAMTETSSGHRIAYVDRRAIERAKA